MAPSSSEAWRSTAWGRDIVEVGKHLRPWIDAITPTMELRDEVADLVILAWAALRQRAWYLHGAPVAAAGQGDVGVP